MRTLILLSLFAFLLLFGCIDQFFKPQGQNTNASGKNLTRAQIENVTLPLLEKELPNASLNDSQVETMLKTISNG